MKSGRMAADNRPSNVHPDPEKKRLQTKTANLLHTTGCLGDPSALMIHPKSQSACTKRKETTLQLPLLIICGLITALSAPAISHGMLYTWKDAAGTAHYTNRQDDVPSRYRSRVKVIYQDQGDAQTPSSGITGQQTTALQPALSGQPPLPQSVPALAEPPARKSKPTPPQRQRHQMEYEE